jgi:hypothetical protein
MPDLDHDVDLTQDPNGLTDGGDGPTAVDQPGPNHGGGQPGADHSGG